MKREKDTKNRFLTIGKAESMFESVKDLIESTAKGIIAKVEQFRSELKKEIQEVKYELKGDICKLDNKLEDTRKELKEVKKELKDEMTGMEGRLSGKIDSVHRRLDGHEAKPAHLAHAH